MLLVAVPTAGVQPSNVYVYCASAALVGVAPSYVGVAPYATVSVSSVVPSSFFHVTVTVSGTSSGVKVSVKSLLLKDWARRGEIVTVPTVAEPSPWPMCCCAVAPFVAVRLVMPSVTVILLHVPLYVAPMAEQLS